MTPPQVNKRRLLGSIMPGSKIITLYCVVVVVGWLYPTRGNSQCHSVLFRWWMEKCNVVFGGWRRAISNNKWQTTPSSTRACGKIVSLIKKKKCIFWLWGWGYFKYMHIIFLSFTLPLSPPPPLLSPLSLLPSLSLALSLPLSLFAVNKRLKWLF